MAITLREASEEDLPAVGRISAGVLPLSSSILFPAVPGGATAEQRLADEAQWRAERTGQKMRQGNPMFVAIDSDDPSENVLGFALWEKPKPGGEGASAEYYNPPKLAHPPSLDVKAFEGMVETIVAKEKETMGKAGLVIEDLWSLQALAVDPGSRRRGIGKLLLQWGMEAVAAEGKVCYLSATPEGKLLYQSQGWQLLHEFDWAFERCSIMVYNYNDTAQR
ncbi:hypothetical protein B0H66DRAFT_144468 [Apodospora peruviana]|uniref:N-acetyltransferase domain-containing protein n=1 Tax=Apodospora peruviana TaxID=516989 RepID=A0AAE0IIR3_9PEZI|nr:hypothetical protein B0H66DRAFT_144468 [Apodospora peruviana]